MDMDIVKRFVCGAKEAYKKVDNHSFNFPITIESAYRLATNIDKLLKEQEEVTVHDPGAFCPKCGWMLYPEDHPKFCGNCGQAVKWE